MSGQAYLSPSAYQDWFQAMILTRFGPMRSAAERIARLAGCTPRAAQNWLSGQSAAGGAALVTLMINCPEVESELRALMAAARRQAPDADGPSAGGGKS